MGIGRNMRTERSMNKKSITTHDRSRQKFNDTRKKGNLRRAGESRERGGRGGVEKLNYYPIYTYTLF